MTQSNKPAGDCITPSPEINEEITLCADVVLSSTDTITHTTVVLTASETINGHDSAGSHLSDTEQGCDHAQPALPNEPGIHLPVIKISDGDIEVEYCFSLTPMETSASELIQTGLDRVEHELQAAQGRVGALDQEIDRLTNHADATDNMVAVGSGLLAGLIDIFWVGEFSLDRGKEWSSEKVNRFVGKIAEYTGHKPSEDSTPEDRLQKAIKHLEKYGAPSDSNTPDFGGGLQHHLRDFAHHPSPIGLAFSLLTQFTGNAYGTDTAGMLLIVKVKDTKLIGKDLYQKILFGVVYWFLHMVSDMAGSNQYAGAGTGLPGPIVSLLKEASALPIFKDKEGINHLSENISKLFNGTLLAEHDEKGKIIKETVKRFDLRAEIGVAYELGRQAVPVILNECMARSFYFIRRLVVEIKAKQSFTDIEWNKTLPWNNRTMTRMLTIATGTFTAVDLADAAIRAGLKSGGEPTMFVSQLLLHVNFVGIGRFTVAVYSDISMGIQRERLRDDRIDILGQQLHWANAKIAYLQGDAWHAAERTEICLQEAERAMHQSVAIFASSWEANRESLHRIGQLHTRIQSKNPQLIDDIQHILTWS